MKKNTFLLLILMFSLGINAQSEFGKITFNKAINISGKQRMLSQKMSKAYFYLLENPTNTKALKDLTISKAIFEKHNEILAKYATSEATSKKIEELKTTWLTISKVFENTPRVSGAKQIIDVNTLLLSKANNVVESIILDAKTNSLLLSDEGVENNVKLKNIINLSGKQRMLSQRLALYYFADRADFDSPSIANSLKDAYASFNNAITHLLMSDFNNEKTEAILSETMKDWSEFKNNKDEFFNNKMDSREIYTRTNNLTKQFNKLTVQYEKLSVDDNFYNNEYSSSRN